MLLGDSRGDRRADSRLWFHLVDRSGSALLGLCEAGRWCAAGLLRNMFWRQVTRSRWRPRPRRALSPARRLPAEVRCTGRRPR